MRCVYTDPWGNLSGASHQDFPLIPLCSARQFILYLPQSFHLDVKSWSSSAHNSSWISPRQVKAQLSPLYASKWQFSYRVSYWSQSLPTFSASNPFPTHLSSAHPALYPQGAFAAQVEKLRRGAPRNRVSGVSVLTREKNHSLSVSWVDREVGYTSSVFYHFHHCLWGDTCRASAACLDNKLLSSSTCWWKLAAAVVQLTPA